MKTKSFKRICIAFTFFLAWSVSMVSAYENPKKPNTNDSVLEEKIKTIMAEYQAVGLAFAVVKDGQLVYRQSLGYKDIETQEPLETDDVFRIASISKSFSATAIMQFVEAGKISLDDDFGDLIGFPIRNPRFPDQVITLRMVLSHTSSISDREGYFQLDVINPEKNPNWQNCYNNYAPGKGYQYCNLNFNMIGTVIEKLAGERFDSYMANQILKPLGLYGGYCVDSLDANRFTNLYEYNSATQSFIVQPTAYHPRRVELSNYVLGYSTPVFSPTGGLKISAEDLAKYMIMHMNYGQAQGVRLISEESSKTMQTPVPNSNQYGFALNVKQNYIKGETMVGHTGSSYGLYSNMYFQPEKKFGFVVVTNGCILEEKSGFADLLHKTAQVLHEHFILSDGASGQ